MNLLSDAAQSADVAGLAPLITKGKDALLLARFPVVYKEDTEVVPRTTSTSSSSRQGLRRTSERLFKEGRGINSSIPVWQDVSGKAKEKATALGVAMVLGYMYRTRLHNKGHSTCTVSAGW